MTKAYLYHGKLPHWREEGATYFVTWRLHTSQPALAPLERSLIQSALRHFHGERYDLNAHVVMDDHVHVLVRPNPDMRLERIVQSWKSFTAHALAKAGRRAPIWQDEYFDRVIRFEVEFRQKLAYILANPTKRWPGYVDYPWIGTDSLPIV